MLFWNDCFGHLMHYLPFQLLSNPLTYVGRYSRMTPQAQIIQQAQSMYAAPPKAPIMKLNKIICPDCRQSRKAEPPLPQPEPDLIVF
jgi:hypothetical protein